MMKRKMNQSVAILCTALCLAWTQAAIAENDLDGMLDGLLEEHDSCNESEGPKLIAEAKSGLGTIDYNGKRVWKGRVKSDHLTAIASVANGGGEEPKYAAGTELAAVWDGDKLLWENVKGAAIELEPQRQKLQEQMERLLDTSKEPK